MAINSKKLGKKRKAILQHSSRTLYCIGINIKVIQNRHPKIIADIKKQLHVEHLGTRRTKNNARNSVYWPCINLADIKDMIESCASCQHHKNKQKQKQTIIPHEVPLRAWSKVGNDLFTCSNHDYVLVKDYTSKYFDMHHLPDTKASTVKKKSIFAQYAIPEEVFSDNGSYHIHHVPTKISVSSESSPIQYQAPNSLNPTG